jgi:hypothetical protein
VEAARAWLSSRAVGDIVILEHLLVAEIGSRQAELLRIAHGLPTLPWHFDCSEIFEAICQDRREEETRCRHAISLAKSCLVGRSPRQDAYQEAQPRMKCEDEAENGDWGEQPLTTVICRIAADSFRRLCFFDKFDAMQSSS